MSFIFSHLNYVAVVALMMAGLFIVFSSGNLDQADDRPRDLPDIDGPVLHQPRARFQAARRPSRSMRRAPKARRWRPR